MIDDRRHIGRNFDLDNRLAALYPVTAFQINRVCPLAIDESPVERAQIAEKTLRRRDLEKAVMAGKIPVLGQAELRGFGASDQKRVVLVKSENSSGMRTRNHP